MKTIGMLGGMSWESTQSYYRALNEGVNQRLGGLHSAKLILYSVDFAQIEALQEAGRWQDAANILSAAALALEGAGADFLLLCTNTMHKVAPEIQAAISIPLLHIADATAQALRAAGLTRVGLLGTRFTMEETFYRERLERQGLQVIIPDAQSRHMVHRVIFEELCHGNIEAESKAAYIALVARLAAQGAQAVILGCTEIALLIQQADTPVPLYDTTAIHAELALSKALETPAGEPA